VCPSFTDRIEFGQSTNRTPPSPECIIELSGIYNIFTFICSLFVFNKILVNFQSCHCYERVFERTVNKYSAVVHVHGHGKNDDDTPL